MSKVKVELHAEGAAHYRALATVRDPGGADAQYGGYGETPLKAALALARTLANVVGYERSEFERIGEEPGAEEDSGR